MAPGLLHPSSDAEFAKILADNKGKLIVVDFFATWCGPCRFIAPKFEQLPSEFPNAVFVKLDVDQLQRSAGQWGVTAMPTIMFFVDGQKVANVVGADWNKIYQTTKSKYIAAPKAAAPAAEAKPAPKKDLPPLTESHDQLMTKSVKDLKHMMDERGISYVGLFEKEELVGTLLGSKV